MEEFNLSLSFRQFTPEVLRELAETKRPVFVAEWNPKKAEKMVFHGFVVIEQFEDKNFGKQEMYSIISRLNDQHSVKRYLDAKALSSGQFLYSECDAQTFLSRLAIFNDHG
jgi:hypothetical protein